MSQAKAAADVGTHRVFVPVEGNGSGHGSTPSGPASQARDWQARVGWEDRFDKPALRTPLTGDKDRKPHHLGAGKFGKVVCLRERASDRFVAVKKFRDSRSKLGSDARVLASREFDITRGLRCFHGVLPQEMALDQERGKAFLVFPYARGKTLKASQPMPEEILKQAFFDIARSLADLHAQGVAHVDVRPPNVMIQNGRGYLIDFGLACTNTEDLLWMRDLKMLRSTFVAHWPPVRSPEAEAFLAWFKEHLPQKAGQEVSHDPKQVLRALLGHPYFASCEMCAQEL